MAQAAERRRAVGFDLDMTLVDTRRGIEESLGALADETGRPIDIASVVDALGPPIAGVLAPWFSAEELPSAIERFRAHMAAIGVANVSPLPGAAAAMDAARCAGFDVIVVTSKIEHLALATLHHAALHADRVFGGVWAEAKAAPLVASAAVCFVGDHPADMVAAAAASIPSFGVTSGSSSREDLIAAGASQVAGSLEDFPAWLRSLDVGEPLIG